VEARILATFHIFFSSDISSAEKNGWSSTLNVDLLGHETGDDFVFISELGGHVQPASLHHWDISEQLSDVVCPHWGQTESLPIPFHECLVVAEVENELWRKIL
jgi:hypothetical protein